MNIMIRTSVSNEKYLIGIRRKKTEDEDDHILCCYSIKEENMLAYTAGRHGRC